MATCADVAGREIEVGIVARRPGDPARLVASNERAISDLGWMPQRGDLRVIVEDAWRWHRTHPTGYPK